MTKNAQEILAYLFCYTKNHQVLIISSITVLFGGDCTIHIETERLVLRDIRAGDEASIKENVDNVMVARYLAVVPHPYAMADATWFINHCAENQAKQPRENYELGITFKESVMPMVDSSVPAV